MLSSGSHARPHPAQRAAGQRLVRGDRPALDWTGDLGSRPLREARSEPKRRDDQTASVPTTASLPAQAPEGSHGAGPGGRRQAEAGWIAAIGGVAGLAIAGGLILFLSQPSKLLATACGADGCRHGISRAFGGIELPAGAPAWTPAAAHRGDPTPTYSVAQPSPGPTGSHPTASSPAPPPTSSSPAPTSPSPSPTSSPSPSPSPTSTPTASPTAVPVQVSYTLVRQHPHSFQGKFTIVNTGSTAINGWELAASLPGDQIRAVWDGSFHTDGDTLYIDPSTSQLTIAPGATLTETFIAGGSATTPASCMFNGAAC